MPAKPKQAKTAPIPAARKEERGQQKQTPEEKLEALQAKREAALAEMAQLEERRRRDLEGTEDAGDDTGGCRR
jgi:hypothetical protein